MTRVPLSGTGLDIMAKMEGNIRNCVPVWFALCAAVSLFVACGGDSSGTSANAEDALSSGGEAAFPVLSSSSQGFVYSSLGEIPVNADTGAVQNPLADTLGNGTEKVPDTTGAEVADTLPVTLEKKLYSVKGVSVDRHMAPLFGTETANIVVEALDVDVDFAVTESDSCASLDCFTPETPSLAFENPYVKATVRNVSLKVPGTATVVDGLSLSALGDLSAKDSIEVNFISNVQFPRIVALSGAGQTPAVAAEQSTTEILRAFHMDDFAALPEEDELARVLAIHLLASILVAEGDNLSLDDLAADIADDGLWSDSSSRAKVADWALRQDAEDGFAGIRAELGVMSGPVPDFEKFMRLFYQNELGLPPCGTENAGNMLHVGNVVSRYFVTDESDYSTVSERFVCNDAEQVELASDSLKDVYSFGPGTDGEVRPGTFSGNIFYTYDATLGGWRYSTELEKDSYFVQISATGSFVDIQDVYEGIKDNERVIFVIRHAERGDDTSKSGTLTSNGKTQSQNVGKKLTKFSEDFLLGGSEFLRAHQTVENIAIGRGQQSDVRDTFPELNDDWYEKNHEASEKAKSECGGGWELTSKYAYTGAYTTGTNAAFYKLDERSVELIVDVLLKKYNDPSHRFVMLSSHDKVMVPLVVYCTNKKVNLKKHDGGKWLNYLAGVAIIIDELGNRRYIPVKGLSSEYM